MCVCVCLISVDSVCAIWTAAHIPNYCADVTCRSKTFTIDNATKTATVQTNTARKIHAKIHFHNLDYSLFKQIKRAKRIKWARISENTNKSSSNSNISTDRKKRSRNNSSSNSTRDKKWRRKNEPEHGTTCEPISCVLCNARFQNTVTYDSVFRSVTFFIALV